MTDTATHLYDLAQYEQTTRPKVEDPLLEEFVEAFASLVNGYAERKRNEDNRNTIRTKAE